MSNVANAGHILERQGQLPTDGGGQGEPLTKIMGMLEQIEDNGKQMRIELDALKTQNGQFTTDQLQLRESLDRQTTDVTQLRSWVQYQDRVKAPGSKLYTPMDGRRPGSDPGRLGFAKFMLEIAHWRTTGESGKFDPEGWKRVQSEGTSADGGFTVHPEQLASITSLMENYGVARRRLRVIRMRKNEMRIPTLTARPIVYFPDEGLAPGEGGTIGAPTGTITESKLQFARPAIIAKRFMMVDTLSLEIEEDSAPALADYIPDVVALAFSKEEDHQAFSARSVADGGADPWSGLLYAAGITDLVLPSGEDTFEEMTYNDILDLIGAPSPFALGNAIFVMSTYVHLLLRKMKGTDGQPLWQQMAMGDPNTLFGFPTERSEVMPVKADSAASKPFMIFGDLRFHAMGIRDDFAIDFDRSVDFKRGNVVMRAMQRAGFVPLIGSAIARMKTSA